MMVSVSLYAVFGALVMRQLESKQVIGSGEMTKAITHETNIAISNADNKIAAELNTDSADFVSAHFNGTEIPPKSVRRLRHAKRRRLLLDEQLAFRHEPESEAAIMQNHKCILSAIKEVMKRGKCLSDSLTNVAVSKVDHCYRTHFKSTAKLNRLRSRRSTDDPGGDAASLDQTLERLEPWSF
ncbi:unnamed protein product, partial [Anisakis simplex]|uniref:Uncharacterized protein n=1 Tax=Anisakis simplex TaxID=6269 RepID=A0A0M3J4V8_ANISI